MRTTLMVKAEVLGGRDIAEASHDAIALADRLGVGIEFAFQNVMCLALPGDKPSDLVSSFYAAAKSDLTVPCATAQFPNGANQSDLEVNHEG